MVWGQTRALLVGTLNNFLLQMSLDGKARRARIDTGEVITKTQTLLVFKAGTSRANFTNIGSTREVTSSSRNAICQDLHEKRT